MNLSRSRIGLIRGKDVRSVLCVAGAFKTCTTPRSLHCVRHRHESLDGDALTQPEALSEWPCDQRAVWRRSVRPIVVSGEPG